jgi:hypothetical protein
MKKIRLDSGLNLSISDGALDNMELLDDLVAVDEGNAFAISRIVRRVLDDENRKKLYDHLRVDGVTPVSKVVEAMKEIFDKMGADGKN